MFGNVEHPVGVFYCPLGTTDDTLGFEPDHEFSSYFVYFVGYRTKSFGEAQCIYSPVTGCVGPGLAMFEVCSIGVPSGIQPEYFGLQSELYVTFHHGNGIIGCQA